MNKIYNTQFITFIFVTLILLSGNLYSKETFTCKSKDQIALITSNELADTLYDVEALFNGTFNLQACRNKNFKLLKYDINIENLEHLMSKLNCIAQWTDRTKKGSEKFSEDIQRLIIILDFVAIVIKNFKNKTEDEARKLAQDIKENVEQKLQQVITLNKNAVKIIDAATDNSKIWKNSVPKLSEFEKAKLLGKNGQYTRLLQKFSESKEDSQVFFNKYRVEINNKLLNHQDDLDLGDLSTIVNDLEQIIYRLKLNNSFDLFNLKQQLALSKLCKDFLNEIINFYGNGLYFTSDSFHDKLKLNKNFRATMVVYLSSYVFVILNKLYGEIIEKSGKKPILPIIVNY